MKNVSNFSFEISLSVLNHLGRNLYRSFTTVLGEAISNSWDADATNVWIYIDHSKNSFYIKDDGVGMGPDDFQDKLLKIGYSKRKKGKARSPKGRPYIGRKGIGKLALLSCAEQVTIISKKKGQEYVGGVINNTGLDKAIKKDLTPQNYKLGAWSPVVFRKYTKKHTQGTIIYFKGVKDEIRNSLGFLKKTIALYFRFSLLDDSFNIFVNGEKVTVDSLEELIESTEFLWIINGHKDPFIDKFRKSFSENNEIEKIKFPGTIRGFIASVAKPRHLKIRTTEEKLGIDLFVNGRLRERDLLKHIPTARLAESYLYGQIHFNGLDDRVDRFTSSREGIVADDPKFNVFLKKLRKLVIKIAGEWDVLRGKHKQDGDSENPRLTRKERKAQELFNAVSEDYSLPKNAKNRKEVDDWVDSLSEDAQFNFSSYADCFISENLIRKYIEARKITIPSKIAGLIVDYRKRAKEAKEKGNINIEIRQQDIDTSYLEMDALAFMADDPALTHGLPKNAKEYKPIRDALMHTALLTNPAKIKLTSVYNNIKGRLTDLLIGSK